MESKVFYWSVGDNPRGRYLRISESGAGYVSRRTSVHTCNIARHWLSCQLACLSQGPTPNSSRAVCVQHTTRVEPRILQLCRMSVTLQQASHVSKMSYAAGGMAHDGFRSARLCCRPRGRSSIIVPSGGADCSAWLAFRSVLARIESRTMNRPPLEVRPRDKSAVSRALCCRE